MPCYRPLTGYYARKVNDSGKRSLVFNLDRALIDVPVQVPCGRCIGCRLDRSLSWAVRCMHEASLHESNCFITLTFDNAHLKDGSLHVADFQLFMKRLRQFDCRFEWRWDEDLGVMRYLPRKIPLTDSGIKFFHCGEYGEKFSRPHHHACLFGFDFRDKVLFRGQVYTSEALSRLWSVDGVPLGFSTVGDVTMQSAAYVARYVLKKWSKDNLDGKDLYDAMCALSSEEARERFYQGRKPEYVTMSRGGRLGFGLAHDWYEKFSSDIFPSGFVVLPGGKKCRVPKYYDSKFELDNLFEFGKVKADRLRRAWEDPDNTRSRLSVREEVQNLRSKQLIRGYENGY